MSVGSCDHCVFRKGVDDGGDEKPPVAFLEVVVEKTVLDPCFLLVVESGLIAFHLLESSHNQTNLDGEKGYDAGEDTPRHCGKDLRCPGVTVGELINAVQSPDAV